MSKSVKPFTMDSAADKTLTVLWLIPFTIVVGTSSAYTDSCITVGDSSKIEFNPNTDMRLYPGFKARLLGIVRHAASAKRKPSTNLMTLAASSLLR